jgi:ABC-type multidrug transport system fused ATPase/permease subunit
MTGLYNIGIGGGIVAVMVYGGKLVYNGEMSNGDLTTFMLYSRTLQQSLITLSILQGELTKALGAAERVLHLLRRFSFFIDFC